ncbi:MAG: transglycosylase domain-containing protein [Flavobacteriaceae bacterium]|nr:transglycosylase domain-containing protein [Flavobacteriaceae bacterium]
MFLLFILLFGLFFVAVYYDAFGHLYSEEELKEFKNETASLVLSDNKTIIGKFFSENRTNIEYKELPLHLINALVATEDARYFEHKGIDSRSLFRVFFKTIILNNKSSGGGSTITQQLAKNMYGRKGYGPLSMPVNKTKEIILAYRLENIYGKEDILSLYLNTIPFGENVLGIESAAGRFFNKRTKDLKIEEAAVLIGMLKANTYYNPRLYPNHALVRRNVVLGQMEKYRYLSESVTDSIQKLSLQLDYANLESEGLANYYLVQVKKEVNKILKTVNEKRDTIYDIHKSGLIIETTLNIRLQNYALLAFKSHLGKMQERLQSQYRKGLYRTSLQKLVANKLERLKLTKKADVKQNREMFSWKGFYTDSISIRDSIKHSLTLLHAGFLALNPETGAVKSWIGGIDYRTQPYDQIFAQRQTASVFKPILYATALQMGAWPCQYLSNDKLIISDFENWQPQNYNHTVGGKYSIAASLAKSMNIPTVNLFMKVPFSNLENIWKNLGFSQKLIKKPSTALGATTASLYEMAIAYAGFANGGFKIEPQMIVSIKTSNGKLLYRNKFLKSKDKVLEGMTTPFLNAMLQKAIIEGTGKSMQNIYGVNLPLAGKTGTSQAYADAWFIAYNPKLVIATRVGASLPSIHFSSGSNGAGGALALPLVAKTLQRVQNNSKLKKKFFTAFKELPIEYIDALSCEDFIEDSDFERFFEGIFKNKNANFGKSSKKVERKEKRKKKKSFFKRFFGRD